MFPRRYFTGGYFAPTYFPPVVGEEPPIPTTRGGLRMGRVPDDVTTDKDEELLMLFLD